MKIFLFIISLGLLISAIGFTEGSSESSFPKKPIQIIVPSKAGGSTDTTARLFEKHAKTYAPDANFTIVNKPGSGGLQGFNLIAGSKKDGYTIGLVFTPQLIAHVIEGKARYTLDDFQIMGNIAYDPSIIAVKSDSDISNVAELMEALSTQPLSVTVNGIGSDDHIAYLLLTKYLDSPKVRLVPTSGSTEQKSNLLGGHVDVAIMNLSQLISNHNAGDVRILAFLTEERVAQLPDIPTMKEEGYPVFMSATRGFLAPKGLDPAVMKVLQDIFDKVVADENFLKEAKAANIFTDIKTSEEYRMYLEDLQKSTQKTFESTPW